MNPVLSSTAIVHLVDDDECFLTAQARMLRAAGLEVCTFREPGELLSCVSANTRGCIVTDLWLPGMDGLELQVALAQLGAVLPIVFLTGRGDIESAVSAMRHGAEDFLQKSATQEALLATIRRALASEAAAHDERVRLARLRSRFSTLTPREREVLQHVLSGGMNKQIAARLGIHERTVKLHRTSISAKLGIHSAVQIATLAQAARLFALPQA